MKTCKEDGEIVADLPREPSRTLKFLLGRGAKISAILRSTLYRPLIQGGMEIPCKVTVEMSPTLKNTQLKGRLMELVKTLYSKLHSPIILGSYLSDELEIEFLLTLFRMGGEKAPLPVIPQ